MLLIVNNLFDDQDYESDCNNDDHVGHDDDAMFKDNIVVYDVGWGLGWGWMMIKRITVSVMW